MRATADYLIKSRLGTYYYRWVLPKHLRARFPSLPKELKRSTRTADKRLARQVARGFHCALQLYLHNPKTMASLRDFDFRSWTIRVDAKSGRPIEVQAEPHEQDAALEAFERMQRMARIIDRQVGRVSNDQQLDDPYGVDIASSQSDACRPAPRAGVQQNEEQRSVTVGEAFAKYAELQISSTAWSPETLHHTHEPSIRVFRELIGRPMSRVGADGDAKAVFDLPTCELTPAVVEQFTQDFRRFPTRQGKRPQTQHAREVLEAGGPAQSTDNFIKRLEHIAQFLRFCVEKRYIEAQALTELNIVTSMDARRRRKKAAAQRAQPGLAGANGYVAFNHQELQLLYGPLLAQHAGQRAHRYWIPLLGLYTGMRIAEASQLRPEDFQMHAGLHCVSVRPDDSADDSGAVGEPRTRIKTLAALRVLPLHPKLIELGLLDYVAQRRAQGARWMWDGLIWEARSGFGRYPSRDFRLLSEALGVYVPRRKVFHSLRSTLAQALEKHGLESQLIDRFIGHDVKTTRASHYGRTDTGRAFPFERAHDALSLVDFPVTVEPWNGDRVPRKQKGLALESQLPVASDRFSSSSEG